MADTQRTRSQILTLFADNVTGQISAQDLRDFVVTIMNESFQYEGDFWCEPMPFQLTGDREAAGWFWYSQNISGACSWGDIMYRHPDGSWYQADGSIDYKRMVLGMAMDSYAAGVSGTILRKGLAHLSAWSSPYYSKAGRLCFLCHSVLGAISHTGLSSDARIIGWFETDDSGSDLYVRFCPDGWRIT